MIKLIYQFSDNAEDPFIFTYLKPNEDLLARYDKFSEEEWHGRYRDNSHIRTRFGSELTKFKLEFIYD